VAIFEYMSPSFTQYLKRPENNNKKLARTVKILFRTSDHAGAKILETYISK
jgi:hypothetical protein